MAKSWNHKIMIQMSQAWRDLTVSPSLQLSGSKKETLEPALLVLVNYKLLVLTIALVLDYFNSVMTTENEAENKELSEMSK